MNQSIINLQQTIDKTIEEKIKEIEKIAQAQVKGKMALIQNDIFITYSSFIKNYINNYFDNVYGINNYNETSLMDSLVFKKTGSFLPDFSYNVNSFLWKSDINKDINKFNESAIYESAYVGFDDDNLDEIETLDSIEDDNMLGIYEDYSFFKKPNKDKFSYYNKQNRQGAFSNLEETYKKAHDNANKNFQKKLYKEIFPVIYKRYGIKIGK